jgi:hypothetical protein
LADATTAERARRENFMLEMVEMTGDFKSVGKCKKTQSCVPFGPDEVGFPLSTATM